jgi:hypothetical protein
VNVVLAAWIPLLGTALSFYRGTLFPDMYTLLIAWAFAGLLLPYLLLLAALIVHPLEKFIQYRFKIKARRKIASMPDLKVIAVTGSYGKTSTKFLLDSVLKERFPCLHHPGQLQYPNGDLQSDQQRSADRATRCSSWKWGPAMQEISTNCAVLPARILPWSPT